MTAFEAITPDTHAKYLLTSGSTGHPKVVINTHRMLCANQQMVAQAWRFLEHEKPVLVDWLPWSHTFGGNHNLNMLLRNGGQLVIDEGRPAPGLIEKSVRNVCEVQPTIYFNVPRSLDMLLPLLAADTDHAHRFFSRLRGVFYAGAALPQATWARLQALAVKVRGEPVWLTTAWGSTETSPAITSAHWRLDGAGVIGGVLPGMELKFVPTGSKLEMRVRGVSVFPGYRDAPQLTARAFDEEGYYCIGDAGRLADEDRPECDVVFDGRVAEDFKLTTGTWVSVGTLRVQAPKQALDLVATLVHLAVVFPGLDASLERRHDGDETQVERELSPASTLGGSFSTNARAGHCDEPPPSSGAAHDGVGVSHPAASRSRRSGLDACQCSREGRRQGAPLSAEQDRASDRHCPRWQIG
jgi:feruloyl-CoA synthase